MIDPVRQEVIATSRSVVVKVGTNVLTHTDGTLNLERIQALADQVQRLRASGRRVTLVSSGAIGAGVGRLGLGKRPGDLRQLQACAAVGQSHLIRAYQESLARHGTHVAQILLTASDFEDRVRYLNARNTIHTLLEWNCLPVINENDTVSVAEIRFGDNDRLAALVTNLLQAPLLVLLTDVDGLYSTDPKVDPSAKLLATVSNLNDAVLSLASASRSPLGTGGMKSKLAAAQIVTMAGESVVMANGAQPGVLDALFAGEPIGTLFLPHGGTMTAWKRWLGYTAPAKGKLVVNAGAREAVQVRGRSLLPVGVIQVAGEFAKGDVVSLCDETGFEFARGLTNYAASDALRIVGLRSDQVAAALGSLPYDEVIHRDNLVIIA
jgi:glutamate 5-kinase